MLFSSALPLAALLATSALANPIQQTASLSSSSPAPGTPQSQNTLVPFALYALKTFLRDSRQYIYFMVQDPVYDSRFRSTCMAMVNGIDGEQLGPDTDEEGSWRPVRPSAEDAATGPVQRTERLAFPNAENLEQEDRYGPRSVMDEDGFIECSAGFSFKTEGDVVVAESGSTQFKLSVKHKLSREITDGVFGGGELIFNGNVDVSCNPEEPGSDVWYCLATGGSPFSFRTGDDLIETQDPLPAEDADAAADTTEGEDALSEENIDTLDNDVEGI